MQSGKLEYISVSQDGLGLLLLDMMASARDCRR